MNSKYNGESRELDRMINEHKQPFHNNYVHTDWDSFEPLGDFKDWIDKRYIEKQKIRELIKEFNEEVRSYSYMALQLEELIK